MKQQRLPMNRWTLNTSSQRDEGHPTGSNSNSGRPCRAGTGLSRPGSSSVCSSGRNWRLSMYHRTQRGRTLTLSGDLLPGATGRHSSAQAIGLGFRHSVFTAPEGCLYRPFRPEIQREPIDPARRAGLRDSRPLAGCESVHRCRYRNRIASWSQYVSGLWKAFLAMNLPLPPGAAYLAFGPRAVPARSDVTGSEAGHSHGHDRNEEADTAAP